MLGFLGGHDDPNAGNEHVELLQVLVTNFQKPEAVSYTHLDVYKRQVTHVDASKGMVNWAKENAQLSGLREKPIRWLVDDCVKFVEREIRRGNHYDGIIMDPPSYGRGPKGEIWKIEEKIYPFIELCTKILSDDPLFFLVNSYTTGLQPAVLTYMLETQVAAKFGGKVVSDEILSLIHI